jgi:transposase
MKRTKQQWLELIQAQRTSDLSIVDFCREKDLPLKSFYARRSSLLKPKHTGSSAVSKVAVAVYIQSSSAAYPQYRQSNLIYFKFNRRRLARKINRAVRMKMFVNAPEVYFHRGPIIFRKQINGLTVTVELEMKQSLNTGALFLFCSKRRDKLKLLYWDKTGFAFGINALETTSSNGQKIIN